MPHFEFECLNPNCGLHFEKRYDYRVADGITVIDDPEMQDCIECGSKTDQLWSTCTMRPDTFWSGVYQEAVGQHFTSESKYREHLKRNNLEVIGDRTDREGLEKQAAQGLKEKDQKADKNLTEFILEETKGEEFCETGTVKERNKKRQKRLEMESAHPEDVFHDPAFTHV